ncbi:regulator [Streptomyces sp. NPDC088752]|uniref:ATP-binding protein n=1 Tax=Streptomyces sp. NPDC088752 TaxID=3154963 RepID=UPI00341A94CC
MESWKPTQSGPFVGRAEEVGELASLVGEQRLVTLVGTGGTGKSRLASRVAEDRGPEAFTSVHWAPLWSLTNAALLIPLVADACGLSDHSSGEPVGALADWIGGRRVLLVLDSCEHLVAACAALVADLLARCPRLVVLATSREPLGTETEFLFPVGPLPVDSDAMELFAERAGAVGVRWTRPEDFVVAAEVCRRLEGLPLALELAAAQLRERPLSAMARLLRDGLSLAGAPGSRIQPSRHRALRTTIGWSHELCEPHERLVWARLSVFRSTVTVADAVRVCRGGPLTEDAVERALEGLVRKSVVTLSDGRLRLYDSVREYGALWLAELGETRTTADRHARRFHEVALAAEDSWWGPGQVASSARLTACHGDLCAALEHLLATDPAAAAELTGALGFFWACSGRLHEAAHYLEECARSVSGPGAVVGKLAWGLGVVRCLRGDHDTAAELADRAEKCAVRVRDATLLADVGYLRGLVMLLRGDPPGALAVAERALAADEGAAMPAVARCRLVRVFALTASGLLGEARVGAEELRLDSMSAGEQWTRSYAEYQLAVMALRERRPADAADHARAMLRGKRLMGDVFGLGLGLDLLVVALSALARGEEAASAYGTSQVFWQMVGHPQRGTPELQPLRRSAELSARKQIGDDAYDRAYRLATLTDPFAALMDILVE